MTLLELCEPIFQYVCRLNRSQKRGVGLDMGQVRSELKAMLADIKLRADTTSGMGEQFAKVRLPLVFFIDSMIRSSNLSFARSWQDLAADEKQLGGDEKFFQMLDETLAEPPSDSANQRLAIFYNAIGVGFTGFYTGQPDVLRRKQLEISARIRSMMDADQANRICPEAYEKVDTRVLEVPVANSVISWVVLLVGMTVVLFAANWMLYGSARQRLQSALEGITKAQAVEKSAEKPGAEK